MTPKEKAKELMVQFLPFVNELADKHCSKQCALICVEEILKAGNEDMIGSQYFDDRFWNGVKLELEAL